MQIYNPPLPILILAFQAFYIKWPTSLLKNVSYQDYLLTAKNDCNIAKYIVHRSCELREYNILEVWFYVGILFLENINKDGRMQIFYIDVFKEFFVTQRSFHNLKSCKDMFINCTFIAYKENQNTLYIFVEDERLLFDTQRCIEINLVRWQIFYDTQRNVPIISNEVFFKILKCRKKWFLIWKPNWF